MLKSRTFGAPFNLLAPNLRASFNIGVWSQRIRGIKYTGGRYFAWGQNGSGTNYFVATAATLAGPWTSDTFRPNEIYDIASNGTDVVIATLNGSGVPALLVGTASLGLYSSYTPAGMGTPRYIEWCSGFNAFIVSGSTGRVYSNATGTSWTVASYPSSVLSSSGLIYSATLNRYYDVRRGTALAGGIIIYSGTSAASCSTLINISGTADILHSSVKVAVNAAATELQLMDWAHYYPPAGGPASQVIGSVLFNPTTGAAITGMNTFNTGYVANSLCGAAYFPLYNKFIGRQQQGGLTAVQMVAPSTQTVNYLYNNGYMLPTVVLPDTDLIISTPAGLVTIADNGQGYTNP